MIRSKLNWLMLFGGNFWRKEMVVGHPWSSHRPTLGFFPPANMDFLGLLPTHGTLAIGGPAVDPPATPLAVWLGDRKGSPSRSNGL